MSFKIPGVLWRRDPQAAEVPLIFDSPHSGTHYPADFTHLGLTLSADRLRADVARGVRVAAVLQFTPGWAQSNPIAGQRSVPKNLNLPFDDPANYWGQFVYQTVKFYSGRIDEWVIWNEPEFRPNEPDAGTGTYTWAGTDAQFAQLRN